MTRESITAGLEDLVGDRVVYFPVRHHSPVCARHLEWLLRDRRPESVLIEAPAGFASLLPLMLDPRTRAPFAVYTSFAEPAEVPVPTPPQNPAPEPVRRAAYYPFCDFSPELVALRVGAELGARLRFIDLDYPDQVRAERPQGGEPAAQRVGSLLAERHLRRSARLAALARRAGCRDHNELWDHLFETRLNAAATGGLAAVTRFIRDVTAWCGFARMDHAHVDLEADGTLAREAAMAACVREELARGTSRMIVVTGGFHTVVLPGLVAAGAPSTEVPPARAPLEQVQCLVRYSYEQLDILNGYAAGIPSPYYYQQLWRAGQADPAVEPFTDVASRVMVELGRLTRSRRLPAVLSVADEIAALEQSLRLAALRGHPGPTREDLLDGIRSCLSKGALDGGEDLVMEVARHALAGSALGEVPADAGRPPLVEDFRRMAAEFRLGINDSIRRPVSLDLYRRRRHRRISRFLHCLAFLDVPYCTLVNGPDFVTGAGLDRLFEQWSCQWTPVVESRLVELGIHGASVDEAAVNRLAQAIAELPAAGAGRDAPAAVALLIQACRMGLHGSALRLVAAITEDVARDPSVVSLAAAATRLVLLWESSEPLEAQQLPGLAGLIRRAFESACALLPGLVSTPEDQAEDTLDALLALREIAGPDRCAGLALDADLFFEPLLGVVTQTVPAPQVRGGVAGLLYADGRLPEAELLRLLAGNLGMASGHAADQAGFLTGLLRADRALAWRQPELVAAVGEMLSRWTDDDFVTHLPHLRLAFAGLAPREIDRVAAVVAGLPGGESVALAAAPGVTEADVVAALRLDARVRAVLIADGLADWVEAKPAAAVDGGSS